MTCIFLILGIILGLRASHISQTFNFLRTFSPLDRLTLQTTNAIDAAQEGRQTEGIGMMMFLWSSFITEQRRDAYFAGHSANTLLVRCLRL